MNRQPRMDDYDFPMSETWRRHYESLCDPSNMIDFPVSDCWAAHYRSIGLMPPEPNPAPAPRQSGNKRPSEREWLRIDVGLAEANTVKPKPPKPPEHKLRGVLR